MATIFVDSFVISRNVYSVNIIKSRQNLTPRAQRSKLYSAEFFKL